MVSLLSVVGGLFGSSLLGDLAFHEVDRVFLKFLANLLFFSLPLIFKAMGTVSLVFGHHHGLVLAVFRHILEIEESIVKHFEVAHLLGVILLQLDFYLLVRPAALLGYEISHCLN